MEFYWKMFLFGGIFLKIWLTTQAATTTMDLLKTHSKEKDNFLPSITSHNNADKSFQHVKSYTTKTTRSLDDFNPRPQIKTTKYYSSQPSIFTSYFPPPSGLVSYKNIQLPFASSAKLPSLLPNSIQANDFTKHPGFVVTPSSEEITNDLYEPMLMVEEPAAILVPSEHNKTIEAAKKLASTLLETSGEDPLEAEESQSNAPANSTDVYIVKSQKKAYIIPTHLQKEATKSSAIDQLYPLREQFEKAYTINQFIFVIKPEKINFLNKLV